MLPPVMGESPRVASLCCRVHFAAWLDTIGQLFELITEFDRLRVRNDDDRLIEDMVIEISTKHQ